MDCDLLFFFLKKKKVKPESIKDTYLTFGWKVQPTKDPLLDFHTDLVSTAGGSTRNVFASKTRPLLPNHKARSWIVIYTIS